MKKVVEIRDITKIYKMGEGEDAITTKALQGVSLDIFEGEFVAIMGPSGSGKSTLMHILGFLDRPTSGTYIFDGQKTDLLSEDELADIRKNKIGFVFQAFNLLARTSALDNTLLPLLYTKTSEEEMKERGTKLLKEVGLEHRIYHKPNELSGGQQQRVAIARALINDPALIFADEPTGNLDSQSGEEIMGIFANLNKRGNTIILVTHEEEIAKFCNRVIKIRDGKVFADEKR
ncbi:MAG: ABC transporter related protein [Candidatus Peregrinibacteria bacterium GW2011_GWA2_33_10]|nr:MAG: ABC transporter related protein [Candidatus Peregrinibacteria bacterium GW2011_GWA2_33_10]KKP40987.1 MAG: ABC-type transporter ATP-binding protein, lipoprotein-releasing system ATP-binding protein [Candidatus Peregrinibacteria bacterium GW2011_GWC2_33_13]